jgi:phosphopantothenoylcysteine decarboxylase/phosphopantothenate--cysteine ligase
MNFSPKKVRIILKNKSVLLGITGGVAAYKTVDLVRRLKDEEVSVTVVMTEAACRFITPLSLEIASQNRVLTSLFDEPMAHINVPASADVMIIAPATANTISKCANGTADDLLSTCFLSFGGTVIIAPSMNWRMYENAAVQDNLEKLCERGIVQIGPQRGSLACGEEGQGRMSDVTDIVEAVKSALTRKDLKGENIVVTAGPTREYIDPVRFISNRSSGKMGIAIAKAARSRGASVTLISGPSSLKQPVDIKFIQVETSREMLSSVKSQMKNATVLVMTAAVSDLRPDRTFASKIEKSEKFSLTLRQTHDIISEVSRARKVPFIIGFAAETGKHLKRAKRKMTDKRMDMIVFNNVLEPGSGFEVDTNKIVIIDKHGETRPGILHKDECAHIILDRMIKIRA